jgi:hypothetical protein
MLATGGVSLGCLRILAVAGRQKSVNHVEFAFSISLSGRASIGGVSMDRVCRWIGRMSEAPLEDEGGSVRRVVMGLLTLAGIALVVWLLLPALRATKPKAPGVVGPPVATVSDRECERRLLQSLEGLAPERAILSSRSSDRVAELAQWDIECATSAGPIDGTINEKWLQGSALTKASANGFSLRDAQHITTSRLCGEIAGRMRDTHGTPLEQALALFDYVIRETVLEPDQAAQALPRTPLESLMIGRATASDRAWIFATLLRQLRMDAVIIEPSGAAASKWLIGVLRPEGDAWLFDPRVGVPIPATMEPAKPSVQSSTPATLGEVKAKPELLKQLDLESGPYPVTSESLQKVGVRLIGDSSVFAPRMGRLQSMISGMLMELFDGLGTNPVTGPGLIERVDKAGAGGLWTEMDVAVWAYPEEASDAFVGSGGVEGPAWKTISEVFAGPVIVDVDRQMTNVNDEEGTMQVSVERTRAPLRYVRMLDLEGRTGEANEKYLGIRVAARSNLVPEDPEQLMMLQKAMPANNAAADFACYWNALGRLTLGQPKVAIQILQQYRRDFPLGAWIGSVPELEAMAHVANGDPKAGVDALLAAPSKKRTLRTQYLIKSWLAALNPGETRPPEEATKTEPAKPETPETPKDAPAVPAQPSQDSGSDNAPPPPPAAESI